MKTGEQITDEMISGYFAGRDDTDIELPEDRKRESVAWRHGWEDGRDDRIGKPRDRADVLKARTMMLLRRVECGQ
jgi:hypothetical protein